MKIEDIISNIFSGASKDKVLRWIVGEVILKYLDESGLLDSPQILKKALEMAGGGGYSPSEGITIASTGEIDWWTIFWEALKLVSDPTYYAQYITKLNVDLGSLFPGLPQVELRYGSLLRIAWFILNVLDVLDWNVVLSALSVLAQAIPKSLV